MLSLTRNAEILAAVAPAGSAAVVGELGGNPRFSRLVELIRKDIDKHARRKVRLEKKYGPASGFDRAHMLGAATAAIVTISDDFNTARAEYGTNYAESLTTASRSRVLCALVTCRTLLRAEPQRVEKKRYAAQRKAKAKLEEMARRTQKLVDVAKGLDSARSQMYADVDLTRILDVTYELATVLPPAGSDNGGARSLGASSVDDCGIARSRIGAVIKLIFETRRCNEQRQLSVRDVTKALSNSKALYDHVLRAFTADDDTLIGLMREVNHPLMFFGEESVAASELVSASAFRVQLYDKCRAIRKIVTECETFLEGPLGHPAPHAISAAAYVAAAVVDAPDADASPTIGAAGARAADAGGGGGSGGGGGGGGGGAIPPVELPDEEEGASESGSTDDGSLPEDEVLVDADDDS